MRTPIIAGNWKMNLNEEESVELVRSLLDAERKSGREYIIFVPFTSIPSVSKLLEGSDISLGAQNFHYEDDGAYTGEISTRMLKSFEIKYSIVGHSERRQIFNETDEIVNKKVLKALYEEISPILCVGETLIERESGKYKEKIKNQLDACLKSVDEKDMTNVIIAYEPIWAIGTGKSAKIEDAEEICKFIRDMLKEKFGEHISENIRILYGGSVKPAIINDLMKEDDIDGSLVGGASLDSYDFLKIMNFEV